MNPVVIDVPQVLTEVGAVFQAYEAALMDNNLAALIGFFWADARVTRYGIADRQWGIKALIAYRAATAAPNFILRAITRRRGDEAQHLLRAHIEQSKLEVRHITLAMCWVPLHRSSANR